MQYVYTRLLVILHTSHFVYCRAISGIHFTSTAIPFEIVLHGIHSFVRCNTRSGPLILLPPLKDGRVGATIRMTASYNRFGLPILMFG